MPQTETTTPATITLVTSRTFNASRERVFRAWTDATALSSWFGPDDNFVAEAAIDPRVGGSYRIRIRKPDGSVFTASGVYREITPPRKLVFTWQWEQAPLPEDTFVTIEFRDHSSESGEQTEIILTHENLPSMDMRDKHEQGWNGCLNRLQKYLS